MLLRVRDASVRASVELLRHVKKIVLVYGALGGLLIAALKLIEYRFLVLEHSLEIYGGIVALMGAAAGRVGRGPGVGRGVESAEK